MKILRLGSFHGPDSRYTRISVYKPNVKLIWIALYGDENVDRLEYSENIDVVRLSRFQSAQIRFLQKIAIRSIRTPILTNVFTMLVWLKCITPKSDELFNLFAQADLVWIGNNDNDFSISLACSLKKYFKYAKKIVWSYQEQRSDRRPDEELLAELVDCLVAPSRGGLDMIGKKYPAVTTDRYIANEDWRDNSEYLSILKYKQAYASPDKSPTRKTRVCILTRFAEYGDITRRRGDRINFVRFIKECSEFPITINLNALSIVPNVGSVCKEPYTNPYRILEACNKLEISKPYDLTSIQGYEELSRNDYGILHNPLTEKFDEFDRCNIPNRFFEYLLAGVVPVVFKYQNPGLAKFCEQHSLGLVLDEVSELSKLVPLDPMRIPSVREIPSFTDFFELIVAISDNSIDVNSLKWIDTFDAKRS